MLKYNDTHAVRHDESCQVKSLPQRNVDGVQSRGEGGNLGGALSSAGVWTASTSGGSDLGDDIRTTPSSSQIITQRGLLRPHSALSLGVVSDTGAPAEITHQE